jgi:site-specific DNA-methyltransferase (adenine-specific)
MSEQFLDGRVVLHAGDCLNIMPQLAENSIAAVVTDPPYGIGFMGKEWDSGKSFVERRQAKANKFDHVGGNHNPIDSVDAARTRRVEGHKFGAWCEVWARECLRVLKPGGHLLACGGTRTFHRLVCAIEDAGFEIRDCVVWAYGSGFPKSHDVSKGIDRAAGVEREVVGIRKHAGGHIQRSSPDKLSPPIGTFVRTQDDRLESTPATDAARQWSGWGTALKPALEPICLARKPLSEGTIAANVLRWGTGALNIDGCRVGTERREYSGGMGRFNETAKAQGYRPYVNGTPSHTDQTFSAEGRWPANVIHDGSDEVLAAFPETHSAGAQRDEPFGGNYDGSTGIGFGIGIGRKGSRIGDDSGSAARFFYTAKADADDRLGSKHPTVKPLDLIQYLCRLICPPGGTILDLFAGTGTIGEAAFREGMRAVLIEREPNILHRHPAAHGSRARRPGRARPRIHQGPRHGRQPRTAV